MEVGETCWGIGWRPQPSPYGIAVRAVAVACVSNRRSGQGADRRTQGQYRYSLDHLFQKFTPPCVQRTEAVNETVLQEE